MNRIVAADKPQPQRVAEQCGHTDLDAAQAFVRQVDAIERALCVDGLEIAQAHVAHAGAQMVVEQLACKTCACWPGASP